MKTRSQTKVNNTQPLVLTDKYEVVIDFDEASEAWYQNKKRLPHSMCKYICVSKTKTGRACCKKPLINENYCASHLPKLS
uniref:Uncharacterized protein n=1 Tax=viral metagenome TaxID=1070528 RepID=A0A6C0HYZ3_9ZZZZ